MTRVRTWRAIGGVSLAVVCAATLAAQSVFRATTDIVSVGISVRSDSNPVLGLTATDFELTDNRVRQTIRVIDVERVPIDLTLVLDASASTAKAIERFKSRAQRVADTLRPDDRIRLLAVTTEVSVVFPFRNATGRLPVEGIISGGGTSIYDALVLALMRGSDPGRRHLVVAFTDALDTTSVIDAGTVATIAAGADSVLHLVLTGLYGTDADNLAPGASLLQAAAEGTGGAMYRPGLFRDAVDGVEKVLEQFRHSYVLHYEPTGVTQPGWHDIAVRVRQPARGRYEVTARKGYFAR